MKWLWFNDGMFGTLHSARPGDLLYLKFTGRIPFAFLTQNEWCAHAIPAVLVWKAPGTYTEWSGSSGQVQRLVWKVERVTYSIPLNQVCRDRYNDKIYILYHNISIYIYIYIDIRMYTVDCFMMIAGFCRLFLTWLAVCSMPSRLLVKRWLSYIISSDHIEVHRSHRLFGISCLGDALPDKKAESKWQ